MSQAFRIRLAKTPEELSRALQVRITVFVEEQGVALEAEQDAYDAVVPHWLVETSEGQVVATARLREKEHGVGKVERVAVLKEYRQYGIGKKLMQHLEQDARQMGFERLVLHAQVHSQGFYEKLGYRQTNPLPFDEEGIMHVCMDKPLVSS